MRVAVIADVHANLLALEAVLAAAARLEVRRLVCLGDLVGYNAEPSECVERIRRAADLVVAGNHDRDVVSSEAHPGTSSQARLVHEWTRRRMAVEDLGFLRALPGLACDEEAGVVAVHGCYMNPVHTYGYVTGSMLEANLCAVEALGLAKLALCGHTHLPMIGWLLADRCDERAATGTVRWPAAARAVLVNPGSVGQPRDGDPRASFAVVDAEARAAEFHRAEYDVARAARAVAEAGLPRALSERLLEGR